MDEPDSGVAEAPAWAVFGDLMSGLLGAFVLMLVIVLGVQLELVSTLESEVSSARPPSSGAARSSRRWPGRWRAAA